MKAMSEQDDFEGIPFERTGDPIVDLSNEFNARKQFIDREAPVKSGFMVQRVNALMELEKWFEQRCDELGVKVPKSEIEIR